MRKYLSFFFAIVLLFNLLTPVWAKNGERPAALDERGPLTKVTFIHYKKAFAKPPWAGGGGGTKCYSFLANGAKWKTVEDYAINPTNAYGLSDTFVQSAAGMSTDQWDLASLQDVFGTSNLDTSVTYNDAAPDDVNTISFGVYTEPDVIAVTNVWGYFSGPPSTRELVEWDMLLNTGSSWDWGDATVDPTCMDVENILAHELGHAAGLGHPDGSYTLETMYAYSSEGETIKRDLHDGDVAGIKKLYN